MLLVLVLMTMVLIGLFYRCLMSIWPIGLRLFGQCFALCHPFGCRYGCYVVRAVVEHPDAVPDVIVVSHLTMPEPENAS